MGVSHTKDVGAVEAGMEREKEALGWLSSRSLLLIFGLALAVRIYAFAATLVIARDGTFYIENADLLQKGEWAKVISRGLKPLYPFLIWMGYGATGDWEISGKVVSLLFGTGATLAMYLLARQFCEKEIALLAALIFAIHPTFVRYSAEVLSESTYIFFFLMALAAASVEIHWNRFFPWGVLYATMVVFAALTRSEGILLVAVVILSLGLSGDGLFSREKGRFRVLVAMGAPLIFLAAIFTVVYIFSEPGSLSRVKSGALWTFEDIGTRTQVRLGALAKTLAALDGGRAVHWLRDEVWGDFLRRFFEAAHPLILFLAAIGLWGGRRGATRGYFKITLAVVLIYFGGIFVANLVGPGHSMSHRYFLVTVSILIPWAAFGLVETSSCVNRCFAASDSSRWTSTKVFPILTGLVLVVLFGKSLPFHRSDKLGIKRTGEWIGRLGISDVKVVSPDPRIAFYAGGRHLDLPGSMYERDELIVFWKKSGADVVVHKAALIIGEEREFIAHVERQGMRFLDVVRTTDSDPQQTYFIFRVKKE